MALLLGLQPVTTDLYLPALPAITQGFGATMPQAQLTLTALLLAFGLSQARHLHIGDLGQGVPELRPDSRYNLDTRVITNEFSIGVDILNVIAETKPEGCVDHAVMTTIDESPGEARVLPKRGDGRGWQRQCR